MQRRATWRDARDRRVITRLAGSRAQRGQSCARLGVGYHDVCAVNPGVVYASISGYGQTGPDAQRPGYDAVAQARSGLMSVTGESDGPPVRVGVSATDLTAGMWALVGILAALHE